MRKKCAILFALYVTFSRQLLSLFLSYKCPKFIFINLFIDQVVNDLLIILIQLCTCLFQLCLFRTHCMIYDFGGSQRQ